MYITLLAVSLTFQYVCRCFVQSLLLILMTMFGQQYQIIQIPTKFCTWLIIRMTTPVNVEEVPAIVLCSKSWNVFDFADCQHRRHLYQKLINYI